MEKTDFSTLSQYIPGFEFLQNLARQATGVAAGAQSATIPPALGHWVAPTFSIEEIDKRIADLRAVSFWLEQNSKALAATIQALEVQRMTLATLDNMNVSLRDVAESFKIKPVTTAPAPVSVAEKVATPVSKPVELPPKAQAEPLTPEKPSVDFGQWWNSLTEQFSNIASHAMQDMATHAAKAAEQMVQTVQASAEAAEKMAEQAREEVKEAAKVVVSARQAKVDAEAEAEAAVTPAESSKSKASTSRPRKKPNVT